jgi:predicted membrane-bound spermidine synthase
MNNNAKLFGVSFIMLFLEIFLIRWISTEVRVFAYVSNLVLLACFLGVGVGCYFSRKQANALITLAMLLAISLAVKSQPFRDITHILSSLPDSAVWYDAVRTASVARALYGTTLTLLLFSMIVTTFVPLGQILGNLLDKHTNIIVGYSINVAASLVGIWTFNALSFFYTKPWMWFAFSLCILVFFVPRTKLGISLTALASTLVLLATGASGNSLLTLWTPYQKLDVVPNIYAPANNGYIILVNNVGYMAVLDLSDDFIGRHATAYDVSTRKYNQYELPYSFAETKNAVLIVGAGAGNDVAGALRVGVKEIDAVEIDPGVYALGLAIHPEEPYEHENVNVVIDDARAFFKKAEKKYDVICFGLLDSHTLSSNYNNVRLDSYVYTEESFREAKRLLNDDGVMSVIFQPTFQVRSPDGSYGWGGVMFITGNNLERLKARIEANPELKEFMEKHSTEFSGKVKLTTDDWPYLYIEKPGIPRIYLLIVGAILVLLLFAKRLLMNLRGSMVDMHFFFLGCAFLLLEFQNVSKASLLFGSTWIVNSHIISSILVLILLSNLFVSYVKIKNINVIYCMLLLSLMAAYLVPVDAFNIFGKEMKTVLATTSLNLPIFFAGVIFIHSFRSAKAKNSAFGFNLIGAAVGGLLEPLSFITGIRSLLVVVFVLYSVSFFCLKKTSLS